MTVYTLQYILTRHLCMTRNNIVSLAGTNLVPQHMRWVTPRVLNRQIKAILDDMMQREVQLLFEAFSKSLKPKSRKEWAPCLAAFLVLCLFMESVETATDTFVVMENEINRRKQLPAAYQRDFALDINAGIEKLPFKQFTYQFHQIYQTHSKDMSAKSFNPLVNHSFIENGELDGPAIELVHSLKQLIEGPSCAWLSLYPLRSLARRRSSTNTLLGAELDSLSMDPILPNVDTHPYPRDVSFNYSGKLASRFLLSFTDEKYIFDNDIDSLSG